MVLSALEGLRILDLTQYITGPYCTKLLAGLGAEVIKIERPDGGDPARRMGPFAGDDPNPEKSGLFLHLNTNKKSITLNLKTQEGLRILMELVKRSDALIENFSPRVMPSLGMGYEALEEIHPGLVMTSISNFGQSGPYRDYKATEIVSLAMGGLMYLVGDPEREPVKLWGAQAQYHAGLNAAVATLVALYLRDETGMGQHVDVSIMESVAFLMHAYPQMFLHHGEIVRREGQRIAGHGPTGHYPDTTLPCRDGYIHVNDNSYDWDTLATLMEEPRLLDPRFKEAFRAHADEMDTLMLPWLLANDKMDIFPRAQELRLGFAPVLAVDELLSDPQHKERGFFLEVEHPVAGRLLQPGAPFLMSETPWQMQRAPLLGEHNEEIYGKLLGYSKQELAGLQERGVI